MFLANFDQLESHLQALKLHFYGDVLRFRMRLTEYKNTQLREFVDHFQDLLFSNTLDKLSDFKITTGIAYDGDLLIKLGWIFFLEEDV